MAFARRPVYADPASPIVLSGSSTGMSTVNETKEAAPPSATSDCPLSHREQTLNLIIFTFNVGMMYLGAPVLYVGILAAGLLEKLEFSKTDANWPAAVYLFGTPFPVLVAWYLPYVRFLRPLLVVSYTVTALMSATVVLALLAGPPNLIFWAIMSHALVLGAGNGIIATFQWEVVGRGVAESRRGQVFAWAYGLGPVLAAISSLGSQLILSGRVVGAPLIPEITPPEYPWNYVVLYGATAPILGMAAIMSSYFRVLVPDPDLERKPFHKEFVDGISEYFGYWPIVMVSIAYVLVYSGGNMIFQNAAIYARDALGEAPENYTGFQQFLRFGCKAVAGVFYGWLLTRTNPKTLLLATAGVCLIGTGWAYFVPGYAYMVCFGILGAGELFGMYFPYYILCCSAKSRMRRNMAYSSMITFAVGFAGPFFGLIADNYGVRASFLAAALIILVCIGIVITTLPARPAPRPSDMDPSDHTA
jgi:MFS family permease